MTIQQFKSFEPHATNDFSLIQRVYRKLPIQTSFTVKVSKIDKGCNCAGCNEISFFKTTVSGFRGPTNTIHDYDYDIVNNKQLLSCFFGAYCENTVILPAKRQFKSLQLKKLMWNLSNRSS